MIIGFNAQMGAGKSEAIETLREYVGLHGNPVFLVKFAQPLYDMQEYIYNRIKSVHTRPENFVKDRKLLQWIGTEWGRDSISKNLWVDIWKAEVKNLQECFTDNAIIVCDDVRFDNEGEVMKSVGGLVVNIRTNRNHERIDTKAGIQNHSSEAGIDPKYVDFVVDNNGTLSEYHEKLAQLFQQLGIKKGTN